MHTQTLTAGQALVKLLANYGVNTVFGIPGVHTLELYRGLPGSGIRHVLTRHEQGAGFMADGYARATGKPGVCFLISGPGVTNAATAIGQAYADSIPLLVISSVNSRESLGKGWGCLHECKDQASLTEAITAFSAVALTPEDIPDLLARAFSVFSSGRPRPVHLSIPIDVMATPIREDWTQDVRLPAPRPTASHAAIDQARHLIAAAHRPILLVGGGAVDASAQIIAIAERLEAQVFSTVSGKGIMPTGHPLNAGSTLCVEQGWQAIAQADVIIAVGTEMAETDFWRERLPIQSPIIRIDIDPGKFSDRYASAVAMWGDAASTLQNLLAALPASPGTSVSSVHANLIPEIENTLAPLQQTHLRIIRSVEAALPLGVRVASDMTQLAYSANYLMRGPGARRWLHPTGFGTLGYGLPAGIGAQIACPDVPVLVMVGDGGLLYTLTELATAQEEVRGSLIVLLWNNEALGQIRDDMLSQDIEPIGVLPRSPDFCGLARAFGCTAVRPKDLAELKLELSAGAQRRGVTLIELTPTAAET